MKKITMILIAALMVVGLSNNQVNAQKYTLDTGSSSIEWLGEKVTGEHSGDVSFSKGSITMKDAKLTSGTFTVDMTSITCTDLEDAGYNAKLVGHLKSDDFFGVENHATATFELSSTESFAKGSAMVKGNLTIKGKTKAIEFRATMQETDEGIRFYANVPIDRTKYDIRYGSGSFFDNLGDKTIYDEFKLKINILAKK